MKWKFGSSRKSSTASSGDTETNGTTTPIEGDGNDLTKTQSRFRRTLTGGFRSSSQKSSKKSAEPSEYPHLHRPFTRQNLEHQKMLGAFDWSFGRRKLSHGGRSSISGVSPNASRNNSVDQEYMLPPANHNDARHRHSSAIAGQPPLREIPGEESDKEQVCSSAPTSS